MKLQEIKKYLQKEKLDAIVLFNKSPAFKYFVGEDFEHGIMFLTRKANYLLLSPLYSPKFKGFKVANWSNFKQDFGAFIKKNRMKRSGTDYSSLFVAQKKFLKKHFNLADSSKFLFSLRETKTNQELERIRKACKLTDSLFSQIISNFSKFKNEKDISRFIKIKALEADADISFEPIVASGSNAVVAHHVPGSKLKKGFLVMDFGVKYKGYLADMTRTIYLGKPSSKEVLIYSKVLAIQEACIDKAKQGMSAGSLYDYSTRLFGKDAKYFVHGLGHGIGVEIHEKPNLGLKSKDTLKKGMVFTIEPGYYNQKAGTGIRIEDDILLLASGKKEVLTKSTKKLICVKPRN